jgi:drug/metabolite transporter (DMT)-like permease
MPIVLALICALTYGSGDFFGGLAARRVHPVAVGWLAHSLVVLPLAGLALMIGAGSVTVNTVGWGMGGGLCGSIGLLFFYSAFSKAPMANVAPVSALVSALIPIVVGALGGDRLSRWQWIGMVLALVAIVLVSRGSRAPEVGVAEVGVAEVGVAEVAAHTSRGSRFDLRTIGMALASGIGFGSFFVALDRAGDQSGLWPLVFGRCASATLFSLMVFGIGPIRRKVLTPLLRPAVRVIALAGVLDVVSNGFYLYAVRGGLLSIVSVISSLYPASTVLLANRILHERISPAQIGAMGLAGVAIGLVIAG